MPDISADADSFTAFGTGLLTFDPSDPGAPPAFALAPIGGTSLATPLVAGMVTAAQQGQAGSFGLDPGMLGYTGQVTLKGYDNMTGVGTPNGQKFTRALRNLEN